MIWIASDSCHMSLYECKIHVIGCRKRWLNGVVLWWDRKYQGPVLQQVGHDRDPSLLKNPEAETEILQPFTCNDGISIWIEYFWARRYTQTNLRALVWARAVYTCHTAAVESTTLHTNKPASPGRSPGCLHLSYCCCRKAGRVSRVLLWLVSTPSRRAEVWYTPRGRFLTSDPTCLLRNSL